MANQENNVVKCLKCGKPLDTSTVEASTKWFGKFRGDKLIGGVHRECSYDKWWEDVKED